MNEDVPFLKTRKHKELCKTWGFDERHRLLMEQMSAQARNVALAIERQLMVRG